MMIACQDLKEQMEHAEAEDYQEFSISRYSDDLLLCLAKQKGSVEEMLDHVDKLAAALQHHVEELRRKNEGSGVEDTEKEDNFEDAKETGSITSNTSKTQRAAEDSQTGIAMSAFLQPPEGEDTKSMQQLGIVTDNLDRQSHWGCNQWLQRTKNAACRSRGSRHRRCKESSCRSARRQTQPPQETRQQWKGEGSSTYVQFQENNGKNYQIPRMSYEEIRDHMSRKLENEKRRMLTEMEVKAVVDQWVDNRSEEELDQQIVKKEIQKLEKKLARYNVPPVGHMDEDKGEGTCRILYSQLNNASTRVVRNVKMDEIHTVCLGSTNNLTFGSIFNYEKVLKV